MRLSINDRQGHCVVENIPVMDFHVDVERNFVEFERDDRFGLRGLTEGVRSRRIHTQILAEPHQFDSIFRMVGTDYSLVVGIEGDQYTFPECIAIACQYGNYWASRDNWQNYPAGESLNITWLTYNAVVSTPIVKPKKLAPPVLDWKIVGF